MFDRRHKQGPQLRAAILLIDHGRLRGVPTMTTAFVVGLACLVFGVVATACFILAICWGLIGTCHRQAT